MNIVIVPYIIILLMLGVKVFNGTVSSEYIFVHYLFLFLCFEEALFLFPQIVVQPPEPVSVNAIIISHFIHIFWKCVERVVDLFKPQ